MRFSVKVQGELARVPQRDIILAKGGFDYPFSDDELKWQLDFLGIKKDKKQLN